MLLSELLPEESKRLFDLEQQLLHLENGNLLIKPSDIYIGLEDMSKRLEYLENLSLQESTKSRRDDSRRRIQHIKNSYLHLKTGLDNYIKSQGKNDINKQKQELFAGSTLAENSHFDIEMAENESLKNSNKLINDYIKTGQETFNELISQKERLKGIQRRVFDIMNYLGISNTIMRTVEKRDVVDKWIVYIGIIFIVALLIYIWWFLKRK